MDDPGPDPSPSSDSVTNLARKFQRELSAGLTSLVLLSVLAVADEDLYGYQIARRLSSADDDPGPFKQGALYPVLRNMSASGLLSSRVVPSYSGPPRRYYRITPLGRRILQSWQDSWVSTREFVDSIVSVTRPQEKGP